MCNIKPDEKRMKFIILDFFNFPKFNELTEKQKTANSKCYLTENNDLFIYYYYTLCKDEYLLEKTYKIQDEISYPEMRHILECINECKINFTFFN